MSYSVGTEKIMGVIRGMSRETYRKLIPVFARAVWCFCKSGESRAKSRRAKLRRCECPSGNAAKENGTGILAQSASEWVYRNRVYSAAGASCLYFRDFNHDQMLHSIALGAEYWACHHILTPPPCAIWTRSQMFMKYSV